jgi:signal transduction protein with GAF and PtsI domain
MGEAGRADLVRHDDNGLWPRRTCTLCGPQVKVLHRQLTEACASVRDVFDAKACVCAIVDESGDHLEFVAGDGLGVDRLLGQRLRVGEGIAGYVAQSGMPVEVPQVSSDDRFAGWLPVHEEYVPEALIGAPLLDHDGRVIGVLHVLDPSADVAAGAHHTVGAFLPVLAVVAAEVAELLQG